jgi:acetyl-CoA acetyltransferase
MREVVVAGVGICRFGRYPDRDYQDLGREAVMNY